MGCRQRVPPTSDRLLLGRVLPADPLAVESPGAGHLARLLGHQHPSGSMCKHRFQRSLICRISGPRSVSVRVRVANFPLDYAINLAWARSQLLGMPDRKETTGVQ